ncbi:MAG: hypothetical protein K2O70_09775, partial [Desulfovibrionaceae bacterium]|nr:hypothetical protein [Desulfovibrionaceae bacterium]
LRSLCAGMGAAERYSKHTARSMVALQRRGTEKGGFAAGGFMRADPKIGRVFACAGLGFALK